MLKKLCQCVGLASLILLINYVELLGGGQGVRIHSSLPLTGVCLAQIADILLLGLALFLVLAPLTLTSFYHSVQLLLAIAIPSWILYHEQPLYPFLLPFWLLPLLAVLWAALLLLLRSKARRWYLRVIRLGSAVAASFGIFACLSILQLLWIMSWHPLPQQHTAVWASAPQPPRNHPLLVWIVFDELAYDQIFPHRDRSLGLIEYNGRIKVHKALLNVILHD